MIKKLLSSSVLILALLIANNANATDYIVSSASQFNNLTLQPCDVVTWTDGTYSNQDIVFNAMGQSGSPIVLKAETPGGVIFTGSSEMNIFGDYLIVDGFYWNGGIGTNNHVEFRQSGSNTNFANNSIFRNCAFNNLSPEDPVLEPDAKSRWIVLYGANNTVENCSFLNKDTTGVCILVELAFQGTGTAGHSIKNNYFYNVTPKDGRLNSGDSEGIRIGTSSYQTVNAGVLVEGNYFQEVNGENEIISNKSLGNTYKNNTFRSCRGSLVLRHGAQALVEGNYFIGENKPNSGGIRVSDQDHIIINNYMQGLDNTSSQFNSGITLMGGNATSGGTSNGYQNVNNVLIAFNTIYNSDDPIYFNNLQGNTAPQGTIANNCIYSTNGTLVAGAVAGIGGSMSYTGNIFDGANVGITDPGITVANANFSASGEIFKPSTAGPVANASVGTYNQVNIDVEGFTRPATNKDVGAHEVDGATGSATNTGPITNANVGNSVGACYLDNLGMTSSSTCPIITYGNNCAPIPVSGISVTPASAVISVGNTQQLTATISPSNATNTQVIWSSTNVSVATVDANGLVTGQNPGLATINGTTADGGLQDTSSIEVLPPLTAPDCQENTNLSLSGSVISFSDQQITNPATNVIDGDLSSRWSAEFFPQNLVIDLGDAYNINGINLNPYQGRDYRYLVEGSATSPTSGFITLVDRQNNITGGTVINDTFDYEVVRYIKLTVTGAATYTGPWVSIAESVLSVSTNVLNNDVRLYPNPFNNEITVTLKSSRISSVSEIRLVDTLGRIIETKKDITNTTTLKFNQTLPKALYFLQIVGNNGKLMIEKAL